MAAVSATIYSQVHKKVSEIDLPESVFSVPIKKTLVHEVIRQQLASRRSGTHSTKVKGDVRGGGKKPFRQKGTGNARQGSSRSSLMVGGGVAFGPKPRDYYYPISKKKKWGAISALLSDRLKREKFHIVDKLEIKDGKTRSLTPVLNSFKLENALILDNKNDQLRRAAKNLEKFRYLSVEGLNPYDIILHDDVLATKGAIEAIIVRGRGGVE
ncbi:MAG: 50S ribosomal protein L4 [Deltaproteobacteria bacterium RIFCSPHIGHO2_12_FULL_43_9]|nr:MAG: 50S ribosomal protein L4 [Deltaproteobacteria bacterium RIFCSPHIGHO2_12_FULL_43_9]